VRLEGKTAVISGGGTGIGAAIARRYAVEGARIVVTGRRPEPIGAVAAEVDGTAIAGDTADPRHATEAVDAAVDAYGGLDIVVANAGVGFGGSLEEVSDEHWRATLETNLTGAMMLSRAAIPHLRARGGGAVVLVASVSGLRASPASAAYEASKAGLIAVARSIAVDHGAEGIRANALCPGWVRTAMADDEMDDLAARDGVDRETAYGRALAATPLRRPATPEEIAACALFLASDDSSFVSGTTLVADGGALAVDPGGLAFWPEER
jgi:NAD(P)-dependent dehydrogenase (short-subunit alcohol dehydrogenase family)